MTRQTLYIVTMLLLNLGLTMKLEAEPRKLVDLSHALEAETIFWPTEKGFVLEKEFEGVTENGYFYAANKFSSPEHGGTHIDAPRHFSADGLSVDQIPLNQLTGPAILVDVSDHCAKDRDYLVSISDFERWEKRNGPIPPEAIVLLRTGFGKFWPDRLRYLGTEERGVAAVAKLSFPGLGPEAAQWLVEKRKLKAVGLDTASIDRGRSKLFESHRVLAKNNVPIFENLAGLEALPHTGFTVFALPTKIKGGSGAPLRIMAALPE